MIGFPGSTEADAFDVDLRGRLEAGGANADSGSAEVPQ